MYTKIVILNVIKYINTKNKKDKFILKKTMVGLLFSVLPFGTLASSVECVSLALNDTIEVELKSNENFENCFTLFDLPQNTPLQMVSFSKDSIRNKITLFDTQTNATSSFIAEYNSDASSANAVNTNTTNKRISFAVTPNSHLSTNKDISLTYLKIDGAAQILIDIFDVKAVSSTRPPRGGSGSCISGRGCSGVN